MKFFSLFFLTICVLFACDARNENNENRGVSELLSPTVEKTHIFGIWRSEFIEERHTIAISADSTYYKFSAWNGGGMTDKGYLFSQDSIKGKYSWKYQYGLIDSLNLWIYDKNGFRKDTIYYSKYKQKDFDQFLAEKLAADSLRNQLLGWWKLENARFPVRLINYNKKCEKFTLQFRNDGIAIFYRENYLDSTVTYGYNVHHGYVDFSRGCIAGSNSFVEVNNDVMKLQLLRMEYDTLELRKIVRI
jgi:hypothetical protein